VPPRWDVMSCHAPPVLSQGHGSQWGVGSSYEGDRLMASDAPEFELLRGSKSEVYYDVNPNVWPQANCYKQMGGSYGMKFGKIRLK